VKEMDGTGQRHEVPKWTCSIYTKDYLTDMGRRSGTKSMAESTEQRRHIKVQRTTSADSRQRWRVA
jgi:hypothetical protein